MGILDTLFKPNVDKLKKEGDVDGLINALGHKDWLVKEYAMAALVEIGKPAVKHLILALEDQQWNGRLKARMALVGIGEAVLEPMIVVLKAHSHVHMRWNATVVLGSIGGGKAVEALITALKDNHWYVREGAASALGEVLRNSTALLKNNDWRLQRFAESNLEAIRNKDGVNLLEELAKNDPSGEVREAAARALSSARGEK
jgi:HEAT repeat protein